MSWLNTLIQITFACSTESKAFSNVMANKAVSIDQQVNTLVAKTIAENRLKLHSIAVTVIFCGHQAIA